MDVETAAYLTSAIAATGVVINALDLIVMRKRMFRFFDWEILRTKYLFFACSNRLSSTIEFLFRPRLFLAFLVLQACAALSVLIFFQHHLLAAILSLLVLGVHFLVHLRFIYGFDGSDHMQTVVWGSLVIFHIGGSDLVMNAAVIFIAAQLILSYTTAGIAKAISPVWRGGEAVGSIIRTETYGSIRASRVVEQFHLSKPLSWATIAFEVAGPLCVLLGPTPTLAFLGAGLIFHLSIAITMGLNSFVWAFVSTFPAVYYSSELLNDFLYRN